MSDVSPGRICKFNSAAGANVQSCGDYLAPPPLPALGKFANSILPFSTTSCNDKLSAIVPLQEMNIIKQDLNPDLNPGLVIDFGSSNA